MILGRDCIVFCSKLPSSDSEGVFRIMLQVHLSMGGGEGVLFSNSDCPWLGHHLLAMVRLISTAIVEVLSYWAPLLCCHCTVRVIFSNQKVVHG